MKCAMHNIRYILPKTLYKSVLQNSFERTVTFFIRRKRVVPPLCKYEQDLNEIYERKDKRK